MSDYWLALGGIECWSGGAARAQITPPKMPTDFAPLVKAYGPAVVNIGVAREPVASYPLWMSGNGACMARAARQCR